MLESIRNKSKGPVAKFIIGLIVIPFAFTGVYSYFNSGSANVVAVVNDSEITLRDFEQAYRTQQQNWGENFDRFFNTDERLQQFRTSVLDQLINQRLSTQALRDMGLRGSNEDIKQQILTNPQFQDDNGNFDLDVYTLLLQTAGYTPDQYQSALKSDIASNQFFNGLSSTNFSLDYELLRHQKLAAQTRDIDYLVVAKSSFSETIDFTSEDGQQQLQTYYDANLDRFRIPEKVSISYLLIQKSDFMDNEISEEDILSYYENNSELFSGTERRKIAHILVNVPVDADETAVSAAQAKINDAKAAIDAGQTFEAAVSSYSEDLVSAEMGGEFGWVESGMGLDEAFENAALGLIETGSISGVIRTSFGYHILKLLETESSSAKPLEQVRADIVATLQEDVADGRFFDAKDLIAERAFEYSDSLEEAASAVNMTVMTSPMFDRQFGIGLPPELQTNPDVLATAFSDEVLLDDLNSEVIELDEQTAVVMRKASYQEEGTRDFVDVSSNIEQILNDQAASEKTAETAATVLEALKAGDTLDTINTSLTEGDISLNWSSQTALTRTATEVDSRIRQQAFVMSLENDALTQVAMTSGDYAIVRLTAVNQPDDDLNAAGTHRDTFVNFYRESELSSYIKQLDANAEIQRRQSNTDIIQ